MRRNRKVVVRIDISKLVPIVSNDGGYCGRECLLCGAMGYERNSDYGYRYGAKLVDDYKTEGYHMSNDITHRKECVLNKYIDIKTGKLCQ